MSEVRKWYIGAFGGDAQARACSPAEFEIIHASEGRYFVLAEDFDNATRLFLDAAERCAASERREKELQQRLTAADGRADMLEGLLWEYVDRDEVTNDWAREWLSAVDAALKPEDGGGDAS